MSATFQHRPSLIVQRVLVALGLGYLPSEPPDPIGATDFAVFAENEPDRPDNAVTVQGTTGRQDLRDMLTGEQDRTYGFQLRVRGNDPAAAALRADEIATTVCQRSLCYFDKPACWVTLDSSRYVLQTFVRVNNPIPAGYDVPGGRRQVFTVNCEARIIQQA